MKQRLLLVGLAVLMLFLLLTPTALAASTWYVDGVNGSDANSCKTLSKACKTIGHAISLASSGDTIIVAPATYTENLTVNFGLAIIGAPWSTVTPIIDGGGVNTVVTIPNASSSVMLSNVTIENGSTDGNGGGIDNEGGALTITHSTISGNSGGTGGGIYSTGAVTLSQSYVNQNGSEYGDGAGIYATGSLTIEGSMIEGNGSLRGTGQGVYSTGTLNVADSTITGNGGGLSTGGIYNGGQGTISDSAVTQNAADSTGGIDNSGTLTITNSTINGNCACGGEVQCSAGGIGNSGTLVIKKSTLSGNTAYGPGAFGGAIVNGGILIIGDSTINGNSSDDDAGGIGSSGTLIVVNSTISANVAKGYYYGCCGGGIDNSGALKIANSTVADNSARVHGGGLYNSKGRATLQNSIVANSPSGANCYRAGGTITSNGYNLSSDSTCPFYNTGDLKNTDPTLGPLQNNGGPTWTQALLNGSPAIDAGNPGGCKDSNGKLLKTDQRGKPRPDKEDAGVGCDMGAYEVQKGP